MTLDLVAFYQRAWKPHSGRGRQPFRTRSPSQNPSAQTALHAKYNLTFPRRRNWPQKFSTWGEVGGFQVSAQAAPGSGRKTLMFSVRLAPGWRVSSRGQVCWGGRDQDSQRLWLPQAAPAPCRPAPGPGPGPGRVWEGARWQFWERPAGGLGFCLAVCAEDFFFFSPPGASKSWELFYLFMSHLSVGSSGLAWWLGPKRGLCCVFQEWRGGLADRCWEGHGTT